MATENQRSVSITLHRKSYLELIKALQTYGRHQGQARQQWAVQLSSVIQAGLNKAPHSELVPITLNTLNWNEIAGILKVVYTDQGKAWNSWALKLSDFIRASVQPESPIIPPSPDPKQPKRLPDLPDAAPRQAAPRKGTPENPQNKSKTEIPQPAPAEDLKEEAGGEKPPVPNVVPPIQQKPYDPLAVKPGEKAPEQPPAEKKLPPPVPVPTETRSEPPLHEQPVASPAQAAPVPAKSQPPAPDSGKASWLPPLEIPPPGIPLEDAGGADGYQIERSRRANEPGANTIFLEAARPDLYRVNAFRLLEMPVNTNARDLSKRQHMVDMAINTGLAVPAGPGRAFPITAVSDPNALREALQRMRDPERRLIDEFFWFWPYALNGGKDDEALQALARNEAEAACQIWSSQERAQSEANISVHNLAVLSHLYALELEEKSRQAALTPEQEKRREDYWQLSFKRWRILLNYEMFWTRLTKRIRDLDDPRLTTGMARRMRDSLPLLLLCINAQMAVQAAERGNMADAQRHKALIEHSGFEASDIEDALRHALGPTREMIKTLCRTANSETNADPQNANQASLRLLTQARPHLAVLDSVLPAGHATRDSLHDEVAQQLLSSQIVYGNRTEDWEECVMILEQALKITAGPFMKTRLQENLDTVKQNLEFDRCWFCKQRKGDKASVLEIKMCGDVRRIPIFQYGRSGTRIEWRNRTIPVPRCSVCKEAHAKKNSGAWAGGTIGSLIGLVSCIGIVSSSSSATDPTCGALIIFGICAGAGAVIGSGFANARVPDGIRPMSAMNEFPVIKELRAHGWTIGEKPPGVQ